MLQSPGSLEEPATDTKKKVPTRKEETRESGVRCVSSRRGLPPVEVLLRDPEFGAGHWVREAGRPGYGSLLFNEFCCNRSRKIGSSRASVGARAFIF